MKTNLKQKFLRTVLGGMGALMLLSVPNAFAAPAFPTTGDCGMLVTMPVPAGVTPPLGDSYNVLARITFTGTATGTIDFNVVGALYTATGVRPSVGDSTAGSLPLNITSGPPVLGPDSRTISFTDPGPPLSTVTANMYAVNGGRTILVQGTSEPFSGVCQF